MGYHECVDREADAAARTRWRRRWRALVDWLRLTFA